MSGARRVSLFAALTGAGAGAGGGFHRHYTGVLTPCGSKGVDAYGWDVFDMFVPDPVAHADYVTDAIDTGYDDSLRVFFTLGHGLGPGQSGIPDFVTAIDIWRSGENDPGSFTPWEIGYVTLRYLRARLSYMPVAGALAYITDFTPTVDAAPVIETGAAVTVAPGGMVVTFPTAFHVTPQVIATCISNTALSVSIVGATPSQCTFHVWNSAGVDVGGTINYQASGE